MNAASDIHREVRHKLETLPTLAVINPAEAQYSINAMLASADKSLLKEIIAAGAKILEPLAARDATAAWQTLAEMLHAANGEQDLIEMLVRASPAILTPLARHSGRDALNALSQTLKLAGTNHKLTRLLINAGIATLPVIAAQNADSATFALTNMLDATQDKKLSAQIIRAGIAILPSMANEDGDAAQYAFVTMAGQALSMDAAMGQELVDAGLKILPPVAQSYGQLGHEILKTILESPRPWVEGRLAAITLTGLQALPDIARNWNLHKPLTDLLKGVQNHPELTRQVVRAGLETLTSTSKAENWGVLPVMIRAAENDPALRNEIFQAGFRALPGIVQQDFSTASYILTSITESLQEPVPAEGAVLTTHFMKTVRNPGHPSEVWFIPWRDEASNMSGITVVEGTFVGDIPAFQKKTVDKDDAARLLRHAGIFHRVASGETTPESAARQIEELDGTKYAVLSLKKE